MAPLFTPGQMSFDFDQRWASGNEFRLPAGRDLFVADARYTVDIAPHAMSKAFIVEHHYAHSFPSSVVRVGLWRDRTLVGLANFGNPSNERVIPCWTDLGPRDGLELNRLLLLPEIGYGGESWFIRRALALVRAIKPIRVVLSYADPVERRSVSGQVVCPGHIGTIYQASNALFCGRAAARTVWLAPNGMIVNEKARSKISQQDVGRDYSERILADLCGEPRRFGEDPRDYLARVRSLFRLLRHEGNLLYALPMDRDTRRALSLRYGTRPYPKGEVLQRAA
jgi:hypothetical protein